MLVEDAVGYWTGISQPAKSISRAPQRAMTLDQRGLKQRLRLPSAGRSRHASTPATDSAVSTTWRSVGIAEQRAGFVDRAPSAPRRTRGRAGPGCRRSPPSGRSGRSCGCASPLWVKKYSIGADRRDDADLQPGLLGDLAQGGLLDALGVVGRSLGKRPARAVALAAAPAEADLESRRPSSRMTTPPHDVARAVRARRLLGGPLLLVQPRHGAALRGRARCGTLYGSAAPDDRRRSGAGPL